MSTSNLLQEIEKFLEQVIEKDNTSAPVKTDIVSGKLNQSQEAKLEDAFDGWQAPIKGEFYNSGAFGIGDARHGGKHNGVDLRASGGTNAYPIGVGIVENVASWEKGGNVITILHPKGVRTYYAHMGTIAVKPGQFVDRDTVIGSLGASGNAKNTFPHIHLETKVNGSLVDPGNFFNVPPYTKVDKDRERAWLSDDHKRQALNFDVKQYLF